MSNVSLTANILTSKVITGNADRLQTYRIQDSDAMMCPVWNGQDLTGRQAGEYSFYTKRAGCNSAMDRIVVENFLRPSYTNFVTTNAAGIAGYVYDTPFGNNFQKTEEISANNQRIAAAQSTGHFGYGPPGSGQYLAGSIQQELNSMRGSVNPNPIAPSAQATSALATQRRYNQGGAISSHVYGVKNQMNAAQRVIGATNWSVNPNYSYFPEGASRSANYVNEQAFKPCA